VAGAACRMRDFLLRAWRWNLLAFWPQFLKQAPPCNCTRTGTRFPLDGLTRTGPRTVTRLHSPAVGNDCWIAPGSPVPEVYASKAPFAQPLSRLDLTLLLCAGYDSSRRWISAGLQGSRESQCKLTCLEDEANMDCASVLKKRKLKMNKHKHRKRRKQNRHKNKI